MQAMWPLSVFTQTDSMATSTREQSSDLFLRPSADPYLMPSEGLTGIGRDFESIIIGSSLCFCLLNTMSRFRLVGLSRRRFGIVLRMLCCHSHLDLLQSTLFATKTL